MIKKENNYAFIDSQNLNLGVKILGWKLNYARFRVYLKEKYGVSKAYIFIGFVALNQSLYDKLQEAGFILKFKPTIFCSSLLMQTVKERIQFMDELKEKLEYKKKNTV